jgi:hypothetical protein
MSADKDTAEFAQRYSVWKALGIELAIGAGAVLPLWPHFSEGLRYTGFWYMGPFYPVLVGTCVILGLIFLAFVPIVCRALFGRPAIVISDGLLTVHSNYAKTAELRDIVGIQRQFGGNALIKLQSGKTLLAPMSLCEQPSLVWQHLQSVIATSDAP